MRIHRYDDESYDLHNVSDTLMMHIIQGVKDQITKYQDDLINPRFADDESQEFIGGEIRSMQDFIRHTERFIIITESGFKRVS